MDKCPLLIDDQLAELTSKVGKLEESIATLATTTTQALNLYRRLQLEQADKIDVLHRCLVETSKCLKKILDQGLVQ